MTGFDSSEDSQAFARFEALARGLVQVPKREIDEAKERDRKGLGDQSLTGLLE